DVTVVELQFDKKKGFSALVFVNEAEE
ncbi:DUF2653 domain-containing protein, partial [Xanthomonas citri pv. citri]|nr:DUF2653 domain-containing protein [Xanthomonas citri pv. citri]